MRKVAAECGAFICRDSFLKIKREASRNFILVRCGFLNFSCSKYNSEVSMKRCVVVVMFLCLAIPLLSTAQEQSVPEIPFKSVPNLLQLPTGLYLGEVAGVAVNSKGHIFVYTRSGQT